MKQVMGLLAAVVLAACVTPAHAEPAPDVAQIFEPDAQIERVLRVEAAIAQAQAEEGVISRAAAAEIVSKASTAHVSPTAVAAEYDIVRHRMVAVLNVWRRSLSEEAANALHLGVTTVDIYDTVLVLQLRDASNLITADLLALEEDLACLAITHRDTPMVGRTLGQHALPITFGKKAAVWAGQNRRNIERLSETRARLDRSGILKGAVGTHLGLGPRGDVIESRTMDALNLAPPFASDWHGARDVPAEYAQTLALIAKSNAAIGAEIFRLQMTDIAELEEVRSATAIGSSTMPHKRNPSLSEALIQSGRSIPRLAEIVLDDVENSFERDNTSRPNRVLAQISIDTAQSVDDTVRLIGRLNVHSGKMLENLDRTDGMILSQRVMLHLAEVMNREEADARVRAAAARALKSNVSFRSALLSDPIIGPHLTADIDALLNPETYLGLSARQVDRTVADIIKARRTANHPPITECRPQP